MGIEALSRGAARAVLVDHDGAAAVVCRDNLATTGFDDVGHVVEATVNAFLALPPPPDAPFTLVPLAIRRLAPPDADLASVSPRSFARFFVLARRRRGAGCGPPRSGAIGLATPVCAGLRGYARALL